MVTQTILVTRKKKKSCRIVEFSQKCENTAQAHEWKNFISLYVIIIIFNAMAKIHNIYITFHRMIFKKSQTKIEHEFFFLIII